MFEEKICNLGSVFQSVVIFPCGFGARMQTSDGREGSDFLITSPRDYIAEFLTWSSPACICPFVGTQGIEGTVL